MTASVQDGDGPESIRETYEEFDLGDATVAMISDPQAERAWIQSDTIQPIEP